MTESPYPFSDAEKHGARFSHGPREFRCSECGFRCTRGPSGVEYGHRRRPRCPRRPESVDPADGWKDPTGGSDG